jgi:hypothetical protein
VEDPGVVGRNVRLKSRLPPAAIEAGRAGSVPSVNSELLEVTVETLAGLLLGFTIWNCAELVPPAATGGNGTVPVGEMVTGEPPGKVYR